ncbi:MAG: DUF4827 domain-containing protein [Paludibacter sp.]|nr:DUF4827 domain-containing protein [Paludibacter sp.]
MKRLIYYISCAFIAFIFFSSCNDTTYAKELKLEKMLIDDYIKRNHIKVLNVRPANSEWKDNDYYLTPDGLYFHLVDSGIGKDILETSDVIVPRYKQYTLNIDSVTISNWTTIDFPITQDFVFGDYTQSCTAFQEAVSFMKRNESVAKIIVPSKIGFKAYWTPATPMRYDLKIKIQK